jgi:type VI secretion system protein ImpE
MNAKALLDAGRLSDIIPKLTEDVKQHPADHRLRTFLFEALCFAGEYDRAARQLDVIGHQNESASIGVEVYRQLLRAELTRKRLFTDGVKPMFLFAPPAYVHFHLDAVNQLREHNVQEAKRLLNQSLAVRPCVKGMFNGQTFSQFCDSDDVLAPILEVFVKDTYAWVPFEQIKTITILPPTHLRDLLWIPATIQVGEGPAGQIFLPALYNGSDRDDNDQIRLGRMTDWKAVGEGLVVGRGQKTFVVDEEERAILEARDIEFYVP